MAGYHRLGAINTFLLGSVDAHGAVVLDVDLEAYGLHQTIESLQF